MSYCFTCCTYIIVLFPGTNAFQPDGTSFSQTVKQRQFSKDDFHFLNVTRVASFAVYDIFDCIFECLSHLLCFSFNFAASKGKDGKLWCDLLSSDKYRNFREYNENMTSHHFFTVAWFLISTLIFTPILLLCSKPSNQVSVITMNYFFLF